MSVQGGLRTLVSSAYRSSMDQTGHVRIEHGDLPPHIDLDLARFSVAGASMIFCGGGVLWWAAVQYQSASMANAVVAGTTLAAFAIPALACIALPVWQAFRLTVMRTPAFSVADGRLSSIYFSPVPLNAVDEIYVVKHRVWGYDFDEVRIRTRADRKSRVLPLWALEKPARLLIAEAVSTRRAV